MRIIGRATGLRRRTGSGTMAQTSGCVWRSSGMRSTAATSGFSPRWASPCSMSGAGSASRPIFRQVSHSPQKSSFRRSQLAAWANISARVYLPTPRGPQNSMACGTRSVRSAPRSAVTTRSLPRYSEKGIDVYFLAAAPKTRSGSAAAQTSREMADVGFLQVAALRGVVARSLARDQLLGLRRGKTEINHQALGGQGVNAVFEMPEPGQEFGALIGSDAGGLMRQVRSDVAVGQKRLASGERGLELGFGFEAISGVKQGREARVHSFERAEVAIEIAGDEASERGFVAREADAQVREAMSVEGFAEQLKLRGFAAAINAFDGDEFSAFVSYWHVSNHITC